MIRFLLFSSLFIAIFTSALADDFSSQSLMWQKIALERELESRVRAVLVPSIKSGEFVVMASVEVDKDFFPSPEEPGKPQDKENAQKKKPVILMDNLEKEPPEDYIVLSKLGLAVPAFPENFFKDETEKKSEIAAPQAPRTQVNDFFKHMTSASVAVSLPDSLPKRTRDLINGLLRSLNLKLGRTTVDVKIKYVPFSEPAKENVPEKAPEKTLFDWLGQLGTSGGIVLAALIISAFLLFLFNQYAKLLRETQNGQKEAMAVASPAPQEDKDEEKESEQVASSLPQVDGPPLIDKFKHLLASDAKNAAALVKEWVKDDSEDALLCLNALARGLEVYELSSLFEHLTDQERHAWQSTLEEELTPDDLAPAISQINQKVVGSLISPEKMSDTEALDFLFRLSPKDAAEICLEEPILSSVFIQNLNPAHLNRILSQIPADKISEIMSYGLSHKKIGPGDVKRFKQLASARLHDDERSPHIGKLISLLPSSPPAVESGLFKTLAGQLDLPAFLDLAQKNLPSELVMRLNPSLSGMLLAGYSRAKKTEFLAILDETRMNELMPVLAPTEKAREILRLDLNQLAKANPEGFSQEEKERIIKEFTNFGRTKFRNDKTLTKLLLPDLMEWALALNESFSETVKLLKAS